MMRTIPEQASCVQTSHQWEDIQHRQITGCPHKATFPRSAFPRVPSAVRVIPHRRTRKNRCGSWACKCIYCFPRYGGKYLAHQRKGEWPECVSASVHSSAAEIFAKLHALKTARVFGIPPNTVHKYEPRATRGFPSHTPSEQSLIQPTVPRWNRVSTYPVSRRYFTTKTLHPLWQWEATWEGGATFCGKNLIFISFYLLKTRNYKKIVFKKAC
ncbi:hypothetical protein AVEN_35321-1 [Araneus ventricosus]|uniref:Uncharacterized protein n=1 Tax=Araneus ventricosus TaxID=182803 RepID=A0A4Y2RFT9_ARAVE|nr:hypothetical protein AVEN_35321-1 [Araneus ventricosus]